MRGALALLLLIAAHPALAQSDAALHLVRRTDAIAAAPAAMLREAPSGISGGRVAVERSADGTAMVGVLVRVNNASAIAELRAQGAIIGSIAGDVVSVRVPVNALDALDSMPAIRSAQAARVLTLAPQTDTSMIAIRADALRSRTDSAWTGAAGNGTLIGVYDTGLDIRHPDFIDEDGATRVIAAWDQTILEATSPGVEYGVLCERDQIQRAIDAGGAAGCPMRDFNGHGTHVAGTAAGNGRATDVAELTGVAPGAELLIVKGGNGSFSEHQIIDGLVWLHDRARDLGRPMVVNLSLGGQAGPHDGTRLFERAIDNLSGPGFIVVTVSGNDGQNLNTIPQPGTPQYFHARGNAHAATTRFTLEVSSYLPHVECAFNALVMSLWYEAADSVRISVVRPDGTRASAATGTTVTENGESGRILIFNAADGPDAENGDAEAGIVVDACDDSGRPAAGTWTIELEPAAAAPSGAPMDLWLFTRFVGNGAVYGRDGFDNRLIVGSPGSARRAITVGAFVTRLCWTTIDELTVCYTQRESTGDLARFSAAGPTRDGRMKPEITAPGLAVASSLSGNAGSPFLRVYRGGRHVVFEGTSMAAPHVTGTVALLLEQDATLGPEAAREILTSTAARDEFTTQHYGVALEASATDWWGHGKLDACAAVLSTGAAPAADVWVSPAADSLPEGASLSLKVCASSTTVAWHSTAPDIVSVEPNGLAHAIREGSAQIVATHAGAADTAQLTVVAPATLALDAVVASNSGVILTRQDARIPLLRVRATSDGVESTDLEQLGVRIEGTDASAWLVLARASAAGDFDRRPPFLAATQLPLSGSHVVALRPEQPIRVQARDTAYFVVLLQTSGVVPNGTRFTAQVDAGATATVATRSGARDRLAVTSADSAVVESTLLTGAAALQFSENPVRRSVVYFNFRGCPANASVHTLTGSRVRDLRPLLECATAGGRAEWDLTNDNGSAIAPGVYLVLFDLDGRIFREKLMVLRARAPGSEDE